MKILIKILNVSDGIPDIHQTLKSIKNQITLERFKVSVFFDGYHGRNLKYINNELKNMGFKLAESDEFEDFLLEIESGSVISRDFIYTAVSFLNNNHNYIAALPAYSIQFTDTTNKATGVDNKKIPIDLVDVILYKKHKTWNLNYASIENTYSVKKSYPGDLTKLIESIREEGSSFVNDRFFLNIPMMPNSKELLHNKENNNVSGRRSLIRLLKDFILEMLNRLSKNSIIFDKINKLLLKVYWNLFVKKRENSDLPTFYLSARLCQELEDLKYINYSIFGYENTVYYDVTNLSVIKKGSVRDVFYSLYMNSAFKDYKYVFVLPWLMKGGVDLFAINYANTLAEIGFDNKILIITTCHGSKNLSKEELGLNTNIDIISFTDLWKFDEQYTENASSLLYSIILSVKPSFLHIMMSEVGYKCLDKYGDNIRNNKTKIIFSSYNYLKDQYGKMSGYSIKNLPVTYRDGDTITTDNNYSKHIWNDIYGINNSDILVHKQLIAGDKQFIRKPSDGTKINVVWAAHIRKEKNPEAVIEIARKLGVTNPNIHFHCYGAYNPDNWDGELNLFKKVSLRNLTYHGPFTNVYTDTILPECDVFLYTSRYDGLPNILLEVAKCGIPIISTDLPGIREIPSDLVSLVDDSNNIDDYCRAILDYVENMDAFLEKAASLKKLIDKEFNHESFINQVRSMINK